MEQLQSKTSTKLQKIRRVIGKFFTILLLVVVVTAIALLAGMWALAKGPSPTAQRLFVMTVTETSALKWLANIYLSQAEIDYIRDFSENDGGFEEATDTSLIIINPQRPDRNLILGLSDDDSSIQDLVHTQDDEYEDMELHEVFRNGYKGYMIVVRDPTRVFLGTPRSFGGYGRKLVDMINDTGAVAGINGGGFDDPGGVGGGGTPDGFVFDKGELRWGAGSGRVDVAAIDEDGILHVGFMTPAEARGKNIRYSAAFGPTLISNGVVNNNALRRSGLNPRTAIGQRADGAMLLLVIEGRQIDSLGASLDDIIEVMLDFDAVNAYNLDGGSSTLMYYYGEEINRSASIAGPRNLPTAFLVRDLDSERN
ncbi:MAG: phosphodiester glycosidase family protein [Oscillospiraceae bacterium]|jgi:exopolysaccharide biosynthesis protein|nr:phosphodiester glycosidase family protein [Oscillospiraceae bacterium]